MKYTKTLILILGSFLFCYSQEQNDFEPAIHSPEVNAFAKFIEFPIDLYTGQSQVSVPIYNLKVGDISVPIDLQYHTGGVKVEDVASWVGINWTLNAGGKVARQINGAPDVTKEWFFVAPPFWIQDFSLDSNGNIASVGLSDNWYDLAASAHGLMDSEHDIYYYSAGNYNGKFIIDHDNNGQIVTIPKEDIAIADDFLEKKITTPDGLVYTYGAIETNRQINSCTSARSFPTNPVLAWFLTKIESSTTSAYVDFNYENINLIYEQNGPIIINEQFDLNIAPPLDLECGYQNDISTVRLTSINSSDGQVITFNKGAERKDLPGDYMLDNIVISNTNSNNTKQYNLDYKYQKGQDLFDINDPLFNNLDLEAHSESMRLFLMGVDQVSNDDAIHIADFTYNLTSGLPSRRSYAQDHFGYYNGKGNHTLVPAAYINGNYYSGANRTSNFSDAIQGSLASMKTSTGGIRNYEYEINRCSNCASLNSYNVIGGPTYITESTLDIDIPSGISNTITLEKPLTITGAAELVFKYVGGEEAFYRTGFNQGARAELKLLASNSDGTQDIIFNSTAQRELIEFSSSGSDSYLTITNEYAFSGHTDYKLQLIIKDWDWWNLQYEYDENYEFSLSVKKEIQPEAPEIPEEGMEVGGLRTKKIEIFDPKTNNTISKLYEYGNGYTSGIPRYHRNAKVYNQSEPGKFNVQEISYIKRSSSPNVPFSKTKSNIVGYSKVTVREVGNGYIENYYYSPFDFKDKIINEISSADSQVIFPNGQLGIISQVKEMGDVVNFEDAEWDYPFALKDEKDWKRGLLKSQLFYDENDTLKKKIENTYKFYDDTRYDSYDPSKITTVYGLRSGPEAITSSGVGWLQFYYYQLQSSWYDMDEVIETNYFDNGESVKTTTQYEYSANQRTIKSITFTDSQGNSTKTTNLYPTDFDTTISNEMEGLNLISPTLSETKAVNDINVSEVQKTFESSNGNMNLIKTEVFTNGNDTPVTYNLTPNDYGNTTEVSRTDGTNSVYLWGYNEKYPVAKIENATITAVEATLTSTDLTAIKAGTYNQSQMLTALQKIRTGLPNALVTTYTFDPMVGMTSNTDPKGYTMFYEYDSFHRLQYTKDAQGNLISKNDYNYAE